MANRVIASPPPRVVCSDVLIVEGWSAYKAAQRSRQRTPSTHVPSMPPPPPLRLTLYL